MRGQTRNLKIVSDFLLNIYLHKYDLELIWKLELTNF